MAADTSNFIKARIEAELASGKHHTVVTRFPPEPNGWPHIGHAKAICVDFGLALAYGGRCHLRFDDTNPEGESMEFVEAIQRDVRWLGFDWGNHQTHASDYFERLYELAVRLVRAGDAYVDGSSAQEIRASRGTLTEPGRYLVMCSIPTGVEPAEYLRAAAAANGQKPDVDGGPPHFTSGMFAELTVR